MTVNHSVTQEIGQKMPLVNQVNKMFSSILWPRGIMDFFSPWCEGAPLKMQYTKIETCYKLVIICGFFFPFKQIPILDKVCSKSAI